MNVLAMQVVEQFPIANQRSTSHRRHDSTVIVLTELRDKSIQHQPPSKHRPPRQRLTVWRRTIVKANTDRQFVSKRADQSPSTRKRAPDSPRILVRANSDIRRPRVPATGPPTTIGSIRSGSRIVQTRTVNGRRNIRYRMSFQLSQPLLHLRAV